ncbi:MAG: ABC-F family ATP-binding cassette domain-containing protein [Chloroflexi bacterium]|jgi:ATP-binding cassette, subfamily F, member 3|nr:ABC-F family ATP-binding cassette domain-containing protein [Chloroflexota bacterium]
MLTVHQISKTYDIEPILKDVNFSVNAGERVGLIGPNGCGKTTLLRILCGEEHPDSGHVSLTPADLRVGYLDQGFDPPPEETVGEMIAQVTGDVDALETQLVEIAQQIAISPTDAWLQQAYDEVLYRLARATRFNPAQMCEVLRAFGLDSIPIEQLAATLSGGQKTRFSLARVLLSRPQLLLLDEPTNHLDIVMLEWLEDWLSGFSGAALIVSHDRMFLESTVARIIDLDPKTHTTAISYAASLQRYGK